MFANLPLSQSDELQGTVQALRTLQSDIAQTLERLEANLVIQRETQREPAVIEEMDVGYTLFGQQFHARHGNEILIEVLRHFAELDEAFPERFRKSVRRIGRKRPYVARSREALYPGNKKLIRQATAEFAPNWFVGTNEDNGKKLKLLRIAVDVLGYRWGKDLKVRMP